MSQVPQFRAVLGVDAAGSGSLPGRYHQTLHDVLGEAAAAALSRHGVEILDREDTGDGLLVTVPSASAGGLLDATHSLDLLLAAHNLWRKPEIRVRMAVEVGPVADGRGLAATKVDLVRMLDADEFRSLFAKCLAERPADAVNSALVISDQVRRTVVDGGHATAVRDTEFAPLRIRNKEFDRPAWVRVPGCDADTLSRLAPQDAKPDRPAAKVVNVVNGSMHGVQAGVINGSVKLDGAR